MKIIYAGENTFIITVIPRFYAIEFPLVIELTDEETKSVFFTTNDPYLTDGYLRIADITLPFSTTEGQSFQIKITDVTDRIVYRGKLYATNIDKQNYKTTDDTHI